MPPRISKTPSKPAKHADSNAVSPGITSKKRKIDWATIDETPLLEKGFTLKPVASKPTRTPSKRRKNKRQKLDKAAGLDREGYKDAPMNADIVQRNPYAECELSQTHYRVQPARVWEETQRYRKFTISEAEFEVGQTIFVSKTEEPQDNAEAIQHWIGKVLEVRAGDAAHVYLRVYWQYRPEDLPGGRKPHHGASELIASNHMDIIEALSVMDKANVIHWDDDPEKMDAPLLQDQLFWRQTFDVEKPKGEQLSTLRTICADKTPINPDEDLIQCSSCSEWLHTRCLEDQAVKDAGGSTPNEPAKKKGSRKSSNGVSFTARLTTSTDNGPVYLTVQDRRPGKGNHRHNVDITCLLCKSVIETAPKDLPPDDSDMKTNLPAIAAELPILSQSATTGETEAQDEVEHEEPKTDPPASETKPAGETTAAPPLA
ncbi:hypothetical protein BDU57DRAFT_583096 [Ampelomyces quisqualis]|uniref:BAH domain-containing protein n=1 Tax=Ampelomyces quisqualis TaxID=50730 RepID=A0A6A5QB95_AMPQU|nr:hypothetical protein BDU57DRAFT_583096 [Ampelomyces quisqualis]